MSAPTTWSNEFCSWRSMHLHVKHARLLPVPLEREAQDVAGALLLAVLRDDHHATLGSAERPNGRSYRTTTSSDAVASSGLKFILTVPYSEMPFLGISKNAQNSSDSR